MAITQTQLSHHPEGSTAVEGTRARASRVPEVLESIASDSGRFGAPEFHSFPARMPLDVADTIISNLCEPGATVLDPMVGSGTTLISAKRLGMNAVGFDLDPLAVLLSRVVTTPMDLDYVLKQSEVTVEHATRLSRDMSLAALIARLGLGDEEGSFMDFWFPRPWQVQLCAMSLAIQDSACETVRQFFSAVLSSLIITKSGGPSYALDLARSRPHRDLDKPTSAPLSHWERRVGKACISINSKFVNRESGSATCFIGDARSVVMPPSSADFVLTSPPYLNAVDYIRAHKFALVLMGSSLAELRVTRARLVGSERVGGQATDISRRLEDILNSTIADVSRRRRSAKYLVDMIKIMSEIERVLKPGAVAVMVVGPRMTSQDEENSELIMNELALATNLRVMEFCRRPLSACRRSLPPPMLFAGVNGLGKRMSSEVFIALQKTH